MVNVLHVSPSVARTDGGPSETVRRLVPALRDLGETVSVLTTSKGITDDDRDLVADPAVRVVPCAFGGGLTYAPGIRAALDEMIRQFDVVHVHGLQSYVGTVAMRSAREFRVPFIIEPHGALDLYHWNQHRLRKRAYLYGVDGPVLRTAASLIVSSQKELVDARRVLPQAQFDVVPLGVDPALFEWSPRQGSTAGIAVLFLGRVTRKKRLDLVLQATSLVAAQGIDIHLTVAGPIESNLGFDVGGLCAKLGISNRVDVVGAVGAERRRDLMANSDAFVLMSEDESFGVAVAEAMAAGLVVITSENVGLAPDAAKSGALILADMRAEALSIAIARLFASGPEGRAVMGRAAREYAANNFTWSRAAELTSAVYEVASCPA